MIKMKHLIHPLRTVRIAKLRLLAHLNMRRFAHRSATRYRADSRYNLQNVSDGFISRSANSCDDTGLIERICSAFIKATKEQRLAPECYGPTGWWNEVRKASLGPVTRALEERDVEGLRRMYGNFFRDRCSNGLISVPFGMFRAYFHGPMKDVHRHCYMGDTLYRIDYWKSVTEGRFGLGDLTGPEIGNPFGALINGTLVRAGSEYQHYCAQQVLGKLGSGRRAVAEIGGGFGGAAYYMLRDGEPLTYINFDVPESIALMSYYLMNAFPSRRFLLYGEGDLTQEAITSADIILMPLFQMPRMPAQSVDLTFTSHSISDVSNDVIGEYLNCIRRMTRGYLLYIGDARSVDTISALVSSWGPDAGPVEARSSGWNLYKFPDAKDVEVVYRLTRG
jgi:hypothetical protein